MGAAGEGDSGDAAALVEGDELVEVVEIGEHLKIESQSASHISYMRLSFISSRPITENIMREVDSHLVAGRAKFVIFISAADLFRNFIITIGRDLENKQSESFEWRTYLGSRSSPHFVVHLPVTVVQNNRFDLLQKKDMRTLSTMLSPNAVNFGCWYCAHLNGAISIS